MDKIEQLNSLVAEINTDADKFYNKGNKAAGTRLRKNAMEVKKLTGEIRKDVTETKNAM